MRDYQQIVNRISEILEEEIKKDPQLGEADFIRNVDGLIFDVLQQVGLQTTEHVIQSSAKKKSTKKKPKGITSTKTKK